MKISMKDVAQKAGVSTATVSHVINKTRFVRVETKKKVLDAMKELNYYLNSAARSLRSRKSNVVGLLVPDISNFFFTSIARGVENTLKRNGYNLIFSNSNENLESEIEQIKIFNTQLVDGLIMAPVPGDHTFLNELLNGGYPVVFIDRKPKGYQGDCVLGDNIKGTYDAISMLIKKGHSRIGIITGLPGLTTTEERLIGYKKALTKYGLKINKNIIKVGYSQFEGGYKSTKELLEYTDITALFVTNNLMTVGAIKYLKEKRVAIPGDIAIIGFDDYRWASIIEPPLSMVKQPAYDIGEKASKLLLKKIKKEVIGDYKEYRLPIRIVIRDSC
jgi:LacI family transcriptional regulator